MTWFGVPGVALAAQFTVTNGDDSGSGSLRLAILGVDADALDSVASPDTIIVVGGPFTVTPTSMALPQITRPVVLDGTGSLTINDAMAPAAAPPPAANDALVVQTGSDGSTLSGLTIEGAAGGAGIAIGSSGNTVRDNRIGTLFGASNKFGITVFSSNNTIGSTAANDGNLISGATGDGIFVIGRNGSAPAVTGNVIEGNTIGGNGGSGVEIGFGAAGNTVGGTATGAPNAIYGNTGAGVLVSGQDSSGNLIDGNFIGTDANGLGSPQNPGTQLPNGTGGIKFAESASGNSVTGGTVFAGSSGSAIDAGCGANQVSMVSLAGGPMPLIIGGQSWIVTGGAATPSGSGVSIPVTVRGAPPAASVEVDLLDASCTGAAASIPYLAGTTVPIGPGGTGTGTIIANGDPPLPVFEGSDANGPLNLGDPCPPTGATGAAPVNTALPRIGGDAVQGDALTASTGTSTNNPTSFAYKCRECSAANTTSRSSSPAARRSRSEPATVKTVRITLNRTGRRLLAKNHSLKVKLTITQNGHTVRSRTITFTAKPPRKRKHH